MYIIIQIVELRRPKKLLVLINPIGGEKKAESIYNNFVGPLFHLAGIDCHVLGKLGRCVGITV